MIFLFSCLLIYVKAQDPNNQQMQQCLTGDCVYENCYLTTIDTLSNCLNIKLKQVTIYAPFDQGKIYVTGNIVLNSVLLLSPILEISAQTVWINNLTAICSNPYANVGADYNFLYIQGTSFVNLFNIQAENYSLVVLSNQTNIQDGCILNLSQIAIISRTNINLQNVKMRAQTTSCIYSYDQLKNQTEKNIFLNLFAVETITHNREALQALLQSQTDTKKFIVEMISSNFTTFVITPGNISITKSSSIKAAQIGIVAENMMLDLTSNISADHRGCPANKGQAHGAAFVSRNIICQGNGGTSAGYGGKGLQYTQKSDVQVSNDQKCSTQNIQLQQFDDLDLQCLLLTDATKNLQKLFPYGGSGGGSAKNGSDGLVSYGGGAIIINIFSLLMVDGNVKANGHSGKQMTLDSRGTTFDYYSGGGSGGQMQIQYLQLAGQGKFQAQGGNSADGCLAGEGSGGFISFIQYGIIKTDLSNFTGEVSVRRGNRQSISNWSKADQFLAQNGTVTIPWCPPFYNRTQNLNCLRCDNQTFKLTWSGICVPCPNSGTLKGGRYCQSDQSFVIFSNLKKNQMYSAYTSLSCIVILMVSGYMIRRQYRRREMAEDNKVFDFDKATTQISADKIITQDLSETNEFQVADLIYHAHRINVIGNNTYDAPWSIHPDPPESMIQFVGPGEFEKFTYRFNKLASWSKLEIFVSISLSFVYYPAFWSYQLRTKKAKYKRIEQYITKQSKKIWCNSQSDKLSAKIKLTKSADYTLLYLDIFNYKVSDTKYIYLTCPYIIYLSGEGNYLRPHYICESDTFLTALYFTCNLKKVITDDDRKNINQNMVNTSTRIYNCKMINRFLKKFNKISMTMDYGAPRDQFIKNLTSLHKFVNKWNMQFFSRHSLKIDLLILQTPFDHSQGQQNITLLENTENKKFYKFISDIHYNYNYLKTLDIKFGIFIYNTSQDPEDINEHLFGHTGSVFKEEEISESSLQVYTSEFDPQMLKENFISRQHKTEATPKISYKTNLDPKTVPLKRPSKLSLQIFRVIRFIRYTFISHKFTLMNKFNLTLLMGIVVFLEDIILTAMICAISEQTGQLERKVSLYLLIMPYPLVFIISPLIGTLWLTSQSYGFLKIFLIFNAMSFINLGLNLIIQMFNEKDLTFLVETIMDMVFKVIITYAGTRSISMNTKLNKLSQKT